MCNECDVYVCFVVNLFRLPHLRLDPFPPPPLFGKVLYECAARADKKDDKGQTIMKYAPATRVVRCVLHAERYTFVSAARMSY